MRDETFQIILVESDFQKILKLSTHVIFFQGHDKPFEEACVAGRAYFVCLGLVDECDDSRL